MVSSVLETAWSGVCGRRVYSGSAVFSRVMGVLKGTHESRDVSSTSNARIRRPELLGEAPSIHDLPIPSTDDAFVVRVRYGGVNPVDSNVVEQLTATSTYPFVVDLAFAGLVERVPTVGGRFRRRPAAGEWRQ